MDNSGIDTNYRKAADDTALCGDYSLMMMNPTYSHQLPYEYHAVHVSVCGILTRAINTATRTVAVSQTDAKTASQFQTPAASERRLRQ